MFHSTRRNTGYFLIYVALTACYYPPGSTIHLISETQTAVVLEYTHSYSEELPAAIKQAEARCQQWGKHARLSSNVQLNLDRSVATFDCLR